MSWGRRSAGLLVFRGRGEALQVLLAHMGGPFWARRDSGAWSVPKGEYGPDEDPLAAARREFREELGLPAPAGPPQPLGSVRQAGGKLVSVWAVEGDVHPEAVRPGSFEMEWPRGSGRVQSFPEVDRVGWFSVPAASEKVVAAQRVFLDRLLALGPVERDGCLEHPDR